MKKRDLELLSSYLDGQLGSADSARLEARLRTDPELRSVLQDLRGARSLLRQLPMRKAPRNFTLTPKMVGKNPPLPRSYPVFKFAATLATILLFFTFGLNYVGSQTASQPGAYGMGGGGGAAETFTLESAPATQAPAIAAATEAPTEAPLAEPPAAMAPMLTATAPVQDTARAITTEAANITSPESSAGSSLAQPPPQAKAQPVEAEKVSVAWQWILAGIALASLFIMAMMRQLSASRWRNKS